MSIGDSVGQKAAQILTQALPDDLKQLSALLQAFADHIFDRAESLQITINISRKSQ